jgi:hypothetical protein
VIPTRDERIAAGCTCDDGNREGVLVDWVRAVVIHTYTDCPLRGTVKRTTSV